MPLLPPIGPNIVETTNGLLLEEKVSLAEMSAVAVGPPTTYVWGVATYSIPIVEDALSFLNRLVLTDKFVVLTSGAGPIRIKATAINFILPNIPEITRDPSVKSIVSIGGSNLFQIKEDVATVRDRVDAIRTVEGA
jgi:hypothetical protein